LHRGHVMAVVYRDEVNHALAGCADYDMSIVARAAGQWIASRRLGATGSQISLRHLRPQWLRMAARCEHVRTQKEVFGDVAGAAYLALIADLDLNMAMSKAILGRMVAEGTGLRHHSSGTWSVLILPDEVPALTPFTFSLCVALYNLLCAVDMVEKNASLGARNAIDEFIGLAQRLKARRTLDDLLAAHLIWEAVSDLTEPLAEAANIASRRHLLDRVLRARHQMRCAANSRFLEWYDSTLRRRFDALCCLSTLLDDVWPWDHRLALDRVAYVTKAPMRSTLRGWLAWRMSVRITPGGDGASGPLQLMSELMDRAYDWGAWVFVAQVMLEVLAGAEQIGVEHFLERLGTSSDPFVTVCAELTCIAGWRKLPADGAEAKTAQSVMRRWERSVSRFIAAAALSGKLGPVAIADYLREVALLSTGPGFCSAPSRLRELNLSRICKDWLSWSLEVGQDSSDGYGRIIADSRQRLALAHGDVKRILHGQEAVRKSTQKRW